jgi:hypothetical protein
MYSYRPLGDGRAMHQLPPRSVPPTGGALAPRHTSMNCLPTQHAT